jgi:uncharacterized protein YutE (UPF0331/DUF86 family)
MVDAERVIRLLDGIRQDVERLRRISPSDGEAFDAIKYRFITAIEGAARVAYHLAVSEGWTTPESNADAFAVLDRQGVITPELATQLGRAAGFRNVFVHRYTEVDDEHVLANLARLTGLDDYVTQVGTWLRTAG